MIVLPESDYLHFEPIDVHLWKVNEDIYVGRPGEKEFRLPQVVLNVLNDIKSARPSPYYRVEKDGSYAIFIPPNNIRGVASWR
ncbi:MAG: hypothetical protein AAFN93_16015 [Bacteroidota bacterium]